jgi:steroid delta-isomerase-like uncharacterized protein
VSPAGSAHKAVVRRYYEELWNHWRLELAEELLTPDVLFRGSLSVEVRGLEGFRGYVRLVQAAFPDFHNAVEELIAEGDSVVARLTYRGTHRGPLFGLAPTGTVVSYPGMAWFRFAGGRIAAGWVVGDTWRLVQALGGGGAAARP